MAGHNDLTRDVDIDIQALFSQIWKKKWLIALLSIMAGVLVFLALSSIAPRYKTTAQLIIEPRESQFTRVQQQNGGVNANEFDTAAVLSQVQIILSDEIALNTIKKLDLSSKKEFRSEKEPSIFADLFVLAGISESPLDISPEERVLKAYKKRLKAYSIENSRVIEIAFWSNDRKLAKEITNAIADEYLNLQKKSKLETDINATKFLAPEIADLRAKVQAAEARVAEFRANSDILVGNNNALLATQQLSEISTELSRVRGQHSAAQAKVESVRSTLDIGASLEAIPEVVASPLIQRLRERQVQLRAQISELSTTLLPAHPRLKALKSQVADFENQIRREARGILRSLENNVVIARKQESSLADRLSKLKAEAARAGEAEVELRALEREAVSERELLQAYMTKFREAAGRQSSKYIPINARIISSAYLPTESYFPKTVPYSIVGSVVMAILSMVGILTVSLLNGSAMRPVGPHHTNSSQNYVELDKITQPDAKPKALKSDLVDIPNAPDDHQRVPPPSIAPEALDLAADSRLQSTDIADIELMSEGLLAMGHARIVAISPAGDEGSQSVWLLARSLANAGKTVAVMDMTGSGITSSQMLGDLNLPGVRDILAGNSEVEEIIHRDRISSANVLPLGNVEPADHRLAISRLIDLVDALTTSFDYLIIDSGLAEISDIAHIADLQSVILVSAIGTNNAQAVEDALIEQGYIEAICVLPSARELDTLHMAAA